MVSFVDQLASKKKLLWVEGSAYSEQILAGGRLNWFDVASVVAWHKKTQGLLKSDVVSFSVGPIADAWCRRDSELTGAMGGKRRTTLPLKVLLSSEPLRSHIKEILRGLRASYSIEPLVLVLPSPRRWVGEVFESTFGDTADVGEEESDSASVYVADFLRSFGELGIDLVLLEESMQTAPKSAFETTWYQSVFNIAAHFRWSCGLRTPLLGDFAAVPGLDFFIAPQTVSGQSTFVEVADTFWSAGPDKCTPCPGHSYIQVPVNAVPEVVLKNLAALR